MLIGGNANSRESQTKGDKAEIGDNEKSKGAKKTPRWMRGVAGL
jgi:hypothetical protein